MIKFICLFFPALICVWLYEHLSKAELTHKRWAYRYGLDVLLINGIIFAVKQYLLKTGALPLADPSGDMLPAAACNYLLMAFSLAAALAVAQVFASRHTKLTIEENCDEKQAC